MSCTVWHGTQSMSSFYKKRSMSRRMMLAKALHVATVSLAAGSYSTLPRVMDNVVISTETVHEIPNADPSSTPTVPKYQGTLQWIAEAIEATKLQAAGEHPGTTTQPPPPPFPSPASKGVFPAPSQPICHVQLHVNEPLEGAQVPTMCLQAESPQMKQTRHASDDVLTSAAALHAGPQCGPETVVIDVAGGAVKLVERACAGRATSAYAGFFVNRPGEPATSVRVQLPSHVSARIMKITKIVRSSQQRPTDLLQSAALPQRKEPIAPDVSLASPTRDQQQHRAVLPQQIFLSTGPRQAAVMVTTCPLKPPLAQQPIAALPLQPIAAVPLKPIAAFPNNTNSQ